VPEPPPLGLVRHKQYPGRKRRNIFAPELCAKKALKNQRSNFGAEFLQTVRKLLPQTADQALKARDGEFCAF
jgi:hypothetical protein